MTIANRDQVLNDIRQRILTLEYPPGHDLDEKKLCEAYGISRTPLRDILRQLSAEGYVNIVGNRGSSVSALEYKTVRDFFQCAPAIYCMIARLAVKKRDKSMLEDLKACQHNCQVALAREDVVYYVIHNAQFHILLGELADNEFLMPALLRLMLNHSRIIMVSLQREGPEMILARMRQGVDEHNQMITAIEENDENRLVDLTLSHWAIIRDQADALIISPPLPIDGLAPLQTA